jgi:hypothetical protein
VSTPPQTATAAGAPPEPDRIDALMEQASKALIARKYFDCEKLCLQALRKAHASGDYDRLARIVLPLQEARRQKRDLAFDAGEVRIIDGELPSGKKLVAGCYLVVPPRVGVDGRNLRELADSKKVPAIVVVREPTTREGLWPLVAVGPTTVRTKVDPPRPASAKKPGKSPAKKAAKTAGKSPAPKPEPTASAEALAPTPEWFLDAGERLGDAAIASVSAEAPAATRVDKFMDLLAAHPDHEKLHQRLEEAARDAARVPVRPKRPVKPVDPLDVDE